MKTIAITGVRGGAGKSSIARLLALGAVKEGYAVALMITDHTREPQKDDEARPFLVFDGVDRKNPNSEAANQRKIADEYNAYSRDYGDDPKAILIIDGCASMHGNDIWLAENMDLTIVPALADAESVRAFKTNWHDYDVSNNRIIVLNQFKGTTEKRARETWFDDRRFYIEQFPEAPYTAVPYSDKIVHLMDDFWRNNDRVNKIARNLFIGVAPKLGYMSRPESLEILAGRAKADKGDSQ